MLKKIAVCTLWIVCCPIFSRAQANFYLTVQPEQSDIQATAFRLSWKTNLPSTGLIFYGTTPDPTTLQAVSPLGAEHSLDLKGLQPGMVYWARVAAVRNSDTLFSKTRAFATKSLSSGRIKVYFNHGMDAASAGGLAPDGDSFEEVMAETVARIDAAQKTIDVAMYNNNRYDIVNALKQAHNRGVLVRYIAAESTDNQALSPAPAFPVLYGNDLALMHNKFMVVDAELVDQAWAMSGSLNWTTSNMKVDYNNTLFLQDQSLARAYVLEFNEMWGSSSLIPNPAASRFGSAKQDNTPHHFVVGSIPVELWFSPSDHVTDQITGAIQTSDFRASFAIFSFTKNEIGNAFVQVHNQGAWVRGMLENINDPGVEIGWLTDHGIPVYPHPASSLLHHKYVVVDAGYPASDPTVVTGSHNWTTAAETSNDENTLVIHDPDIALLFQAEFEQRWMETTTATTLPQQAVFQLFPNPATDEFFVRNTQEESWSGRIEIWKISGQLYRGQTVSGISLFRIDLHDVPAGSYILKIISDRGTSTFPFQTLPR